MKILIVDDSKADRMLCRILLEESRGTELLEFLEVGDGTRGLEACREFSPDCVLIDYRLPDMTGLEFLEHIPQESQDDRFAIVMLTGLGSGMVAAAALKAGAHEYIMKDHLTAEALRLSVEKATTRRDLIRSLKGERDRLASLLGEKEILLKEVHHRVKNNLAVIASLLNLQASTCVNAQVAGALRASQHRVESMALIHEQLYATADLAGVDLGKHVTMLATSLFHSYGIDPERVSWTVAMEPVELGLDQAIPAGLILGELISNVLKHGFPEGRRGSIAITGTRRSGQIELTVNDNGVGVSNEVDFAKPKSLGMQIVKILARQLKGTFEVAHRNPATFKISFPEAKNGEQIVQSAGSGG
ncbi:MAG TPA: histidine kinase dimerization/phosphoacceptor domain -containing protein [Bryobacteraceae bacterium]|jgi:two-component sensor histidine kinase|nr:histidine kinase dimerization/phosphoacceptor domain -containing protein [Bryobacteraceae bacterium]